MDQLPTEKVAVQQQVTVYPALNQNDPRFRCASTQCSNHSIMGNTAALGALWCFSGDVLRDRFTIMHSAGLWWSSLYEVRLGEEDVKTNRIRHETTIPCQPC